MLKFKCLVAAALAAVAAVPASALYAPTGPQLNVALSTVTGGGWTQCYAAPMSTFLGSSASAALSACTGDRILLAGRATGSDTLLALAQTTKADAFFDTGTSNDTHFADGSEWYNGDDYSWGFAPGGETVDRGECDTAGGDGRICLHTVNGAGGYRINDLFGLNDSDEYEKLVFTADGEAVPEPATWALMLGGFAMVGAAMRRRTALVA